MLECGGKSRQIVIADGRDRLDVAAADPADAASWNAGQNCTAGSRILVDRSIKDEFERGARGVLRIGRVRARLRQLRGGAADANDSPCGLAATVWSKDIDRAVRTARSVRAGTVADGRGQWLQRREHRDAVRRDKPPGFGGRDKGLEALERYTELKTIWITLR